MSAIDPLRTLQRGAIVSPWGGEHHARKNGHLISLRGSAGARQRNLTWFRRLPEPPEETVTPMGVVLFFRGVAPLPPHDPEGAESPVVTIWLPQIRRATCGLPAQSTSSRRQSVGSQKWRSCTALSKFGSHRKRSSTIRSVERKTHTTITSKAQRRTEGSFMAYVRE